MFLCFRSCSTGQESSEFSPVILQLPGTMTFQETFTEDLRNKESIKYKTMEEKSCNQVQTLEIFAKFNHVSFDVTMLQIQRLVGHHLHNRKTIGSIVPLNETARFLFH